MARLKRNLTIWTIAAHLLHHCSTFTALLLNTKFRLILEEEKFQFLNWCYLFEGLIENGKVKKELNKTWQTILIILSQVVYLKYRQDILVLQHAAQFQHILFLSSSSLRNLGVGFGFPKGNPNQKWAILLFRWFDVRLMDRVRELKESSWMMVLTLPSLGNCSMRLSM